VPSASEEGRAIREIRRAFLRAEWRQLALLHFEIDPVLLAPFVPPGLELEGFGGRHYLGLVGFRFLRTCLLGIPVPFHQAFPEVNLRFYLRGKVGGQWRSGVRFLRELVPRRAVAWAARAAYGEPYEYLPLAATFTPAEEPLPLRLGYRWRGAGEACGFEVERQAAPLASGGLESFLAEHHWGFGVSPFGRTLAYRVARNPWTLYPATLAERVGDLGEFYGGPFAETLRRPPASVVVAEGSPIAVGFPEPVDR
jgi:hypothetical protein